MRNEHHIHQYKPFLFLHFLFGLIMLAFVFPTNIFGEQEPKLCLTMIIKNDEAVIEKCLDSVKDIVDCVCICDVGSTDNTTHIIEKFMWERGIRGKIFHHEWVNYGHNRTLSVETAQKMLKEFKFPLESCYLLILDPNSLITIGESFKKSALKEDAYLLLEKSSAPSYFSYNLRLLRSSFLWKSIGVVHEHWSYKGPHDCVKLATLKIEDQENESYNIEKIKKEVELLANALVGEPENERYMFHLAQSYKALKNYEEAIKWYHERIEKQGDKEEIWFSKFMIGECYEFMGKWGDATFWYLDAYQSNPERAESLHKLANYYRYQGQNNLAYLFAKHGSRVPFPDNPILFNSPPLYDYQFDEELSIASYYTHFKDDGYKAISDLSLKRSAPWYVKENAYRNLMYYVQNLKNARYHTITIARPLILEDSDQHYNPMNPSIQKTKNGYSVICRTVNYTQTGAKIFNTIDPMGIFRTKNFLLHYDQDFKLISQQEIIEKLPRERIRAISIEGLEDCRIFDLQGKTWFTCTTSDTNPTGNLQISLCKLSEEKWGRTIQVDKLVPLIGPDLNRTEKNWLPFIKDEQFHVVYSYDPFTIFKPNMETGQCETVVSYQPTHDFSRFRGSAGPLELDGGYLMLVHEVTLFPDYSRCYYHRFLFLDKNFKVQKVSQPFTFFHLGIEYCCSMTLDHSGKQLVLAVGIEDREAYLGFVDLDTVRSLLHSLPINYNSPY